MDSWYDNVKIPFQLKFQFQFSTVSSVLTKPLDYYHFLARSRLQFCPSDEPIWVVELSLSHMPEHTFVISWNAKKEMHSLLRIIWIWFYGTYKEKSLPRRIYSQRVDTFVFFY